MTSVQIPRDEVKRRLVGVCRLLQTLVKGSYGPLGRAQLIQANAQCPDAVTITSIAERYFASISIGDCPIANAYFHILKSKIRDHADAGLFLAGLSSSLQLEIQEGCLAQVPHHIVRKGLHLALDWSLSFLDNPRCPVRVAVDWSSTTSVFAVIRGIVSTKSVTGLGESAVDTVILPLIIEAFLLYAPGQTSITQSQVWKQTVLLDLPWPCRRGSKCSKRGPLTPPLCNVRVALFNITIEPLAESETEDINGANIHHTGSLDKFRLEALRQVGDRLERLGATAVLSQKIIPKYLQAYLASKGIFTLDRLAITNIRSVQMLSGATILSDWRIDDSIIINSLGFLSLVTRQTLGSKLYIRLHRDNSDQPPSTLQSTAIDNTNRRSHPVTTIAVAAPDRFSYDELCHVTVTSFKALASLMNDPQAIAGAGCTEIHLAALLRHRVSELQSSTASQGAQYGSQEARTLRQLSQIVTAFAESLDNLAGHLCGGHATTVDRAYMIEHIHSANRESLLATADSPVSSRHQCELFGWDPRKRSVMPVLSYSSHGDNESGDENIIVHAHILETLQFKKDALVLAVESVSSLMGIASVVRVP